MRKLLFAAALATTAAMAVPIIARSAPEQELRQAQAAPADEHQGRGPGRWMHGEGMGGWRGMMHHRMMHQDPQERCVDRLAWRAAMRAYTEAKLNRCPRSRQSRSASPAGAAVGDRSCGGHGNERAASSSHQPLERTFI